MLTDAPVSPITELDLAPQAPDTTRVVRVKHGGAETSAMLLEADNLSVRSAPDGSAIIELFRYTHTGRCIESYQVRFCPQDRARLRAIL